MLASLIVLAAAAQAATATAAPDAAPPPAVAPSGPMDVDIGIAAPTPDGATAVREDVEDLLARRGLTARYRALSAVDREEVLRPAKEAPCALACIWIDLGVAAPARASIYISATASEQVVIRSLPLPAGVDEVAREEVAHIVATSVEALQAGRPLPVAPDAMEATLAKAVRPSAPPPPSRPRTVWLAGLGGGAAHEGASQVALPVVGLSLVVGDEGRRLSPALWVAAAAFSSDAAGQDVSLTFRGGELAALAAIGTPATGRDGGARRRVVARLGVGPGVEVRDAAPSTPPAATDVVPDEASLAASVFVRAAARLEVRLFDAMGLFVAAACDARVVNHRYIVEHDGMPATVFEPDLLRPSLVIGLDARLGREGAP